MQNREEVVSEYFRLLIKLNSANLRQNQRTQLDFEIIEEGEGIYHFRAFLHRENQFTALILSRYYAQYGWQPSGYSEFIYLEHYITSELKNKQRQLSINEGYSIGKNKNELIKHVKMQLLSMGVPRVNQ